MYRIMLVSPPVNRPSVNTQWLWALEGEREGQELHDRKCCPHIKSEPRAQTFMLWAHPSPICASQWEKLPSHWRWNEPKDTIWRTIWLRLLWAHASACISFCSHMVCKWHALIRTVPGQRASYHRGFITYTSWLSEACAHAFNSWRKMVSRMPQRRFHRDIWTCVCAHESKPNTLNCVCALGSDSVLSKHMSTTDVNSWFSHSPWSAQSLILCLHDVNWEWPYHTHWVWGKKKLFYQYKKILSFVHPIETNMSSHSHSCVCFTNRKISEYSCSNG
jgi:hypothetical protein